MASVVVTAKDVAAIEAAMELVKGNKSLFSQLARILSKWETANRRAKGMSFQTFAAIVDGVVGKDRWRVESVAMLVKLLRDYAVTEEQIVAVVTQMLATKPLPLLGIYWELRRAMLGITSLGEVPDVSAKTGVIQNL